MNALSPLLVSIRPSRLLLRTFALALCWLLLLRLVVGVHASTWLLSPLALVSDVAGAVMLTALLLLLRRGWPRWLFLLFLAMAFYAAGEHLAAHGTLFRVPHIIDALDPTFVGSTGAFGWDMLALPVYLALVWGLDRLHRRLIANEPGRPRSDLRLETAGVALIAVYALTVPNLMAPVNNVVATALAQAPLTVAGFGGPVEAHEVEPIEEAIAERFFDQQRGAVRTAERPNILVIMIEGLSAAYLPGIADYHGLENPAVVLPDLEQGLEQRGFRLYRNVLSMQRQTDRGTYPMLCGEYPRLSSEEPKMTSIVEGANAPDCLPGILARNGYFTSYQQAAHLDYMGKDRFMPRAGFAEALGASELAPDTEIEGWGLMDDRFFARAGDNLLDLAERRQQPWFATLHNVGTHHPFAQPKPVEEPAPAVAELDNELSDLAAELAEEPHQDRQAAFSAMAEELLALLARLEGAGALDDTMVVVTSDEAGGFIRDDAEPHPLSGNFGFMAVRPPPGMERDALRGRDDLVAHMDLALTGADAAGVAGSDPGVRRMIGHSLFARDGDGSRGLMLGNTYNGQSLFLLGSGRLMQCAETLLRCENWTFDAERVVGSLTPREDAAFLDLEARQRLADRAALIDHAATAD